MTERTFLRLMVVGLVIVTIIGMTLSYALLEVADRADDAASTADDARVAATLQRERICSESHPENCRQLAERLAENTTREQAHRLACELLTTLGYQKVLVRIRARGNCVRRERGRAEP